MNSTVHSFEIVIQTTEFFYSLISFNECVQKVYLSFYKLKMSFCVPKVKDSLFYSLQSGFCYSVKIKDKQK